MPSICEHQTYSYLEMWYGKVECFIMLELRESKLLKY